MRRLVTIGTGSGLAVKGRGGASHLVEVDGQSVLFDAGEGSAGGLRALNHLLALDSVFITHLHTDHIAGLMVLIQNSLLEGRQRPLDIHLPQEGIQTIIALRNTSYLNPNRLPFEAFDLRFHPVQTESPYEFGSFQVRAWPSDHLSPRDRLRGHPPRPAFGFTVNSETARLVYTGDVGTTDCFASELAPGTTLLCDAMRIAWETVAGLAADRQVRQTIFTHADPARLDELSAFVSKSDRLAVAADGREFEW
jgi:ribonuclease BN (tRNA processing enzyme)